MLNRFRTQRAVVATAAVTVLESLLSSQGSHMVARQGLKAAVLLSIAVTASCNRTPPEDLDRQGVAYRDGQGVTQSDTRAVELLQRACDGGSMSGCANLGVMYQDGRGVTRR